MAFPILFASGDDLIAHALEEPKDNRVWHFFEHGGIFPNGLSLDLPSTELFAITKFKILILPFNSMSKLQAALRKNSSNEQILWKTACTDKPLFKSNSFFIAHFDFM